MKSLFAPFLAHPLIAGTILLSTFVLPSQAQYSDDQEFDFANALVDLGFRDYAKRVVDGLASRSKNKSLIELFEVRNLIGSGKFGEAEDLLKEVDDGPAKYKMMMRLGDIHFSKGTTEKTAKLYEEVFQKYKEVPKDPVAREFYLESAYKFFKLMQMVDNVPGAIEALVRVRASTTNQFVLRKTTVDLANLKVDLAEEAKAAPRAKLLKEARAICNDLFMVPDKFFGDAIGVLTRIELLDKNFDRALALINDYTPMCLEIENQMLKQAEVTGVAKKNILANSPMAAIRYQKARIYMKLRDKGIEEKNIENVKRFLVAGYKEYLNTFYKYQDSEWGADAAVKVFEVSDWAKQKLGVKLEPKGGRAAIMSLMLESANSMYERKMYPEAISAYQRIYDNFPVETPKVAESLKNYAYAYINGSKNGQLEEEEFADWMPRIIASYLATRFTRFPEAGDSIYRIGGHYFSQGDEDTATEIFGYFADGFPDDPRAATILFNEAEYARKAWAETRKPGSRERAFKLYEQVASEKYKDTQSFLIALDRLATDYSDSGDWAKARPFLVKIIDQSPEGFGKAIAEFKLTNCDYALEDYKTCIAGLQKLLTDLDEKEIFVNALDRKNIDSLLENVLFRLGATCAKWAHSSDEARQALIRSNTLARVKAGEDRAAARAAELEANAPEALVTTLEAKAVEFWNDQLSRFGKIRDSGTGKLAPKALEGQGRINMANGDIDAALKSFQRIADRFPETPEAERVYYYLVREGLRLELDDVVEKYVGGMISSPGTYSAAQLLQVGQLLNNEGKFKEGKAILAKASTHPDTQKDTSASKSMLQRALKAQVIAANESGDNAGCIAAGEKLLKEFPKTPYKFEINRELAKAYRMSGNYPKAEESIRWVFAYYGTSAADPKFEKMKADYELAQILEAWSATDEKKKGKAIASYYRLTQRQPPRPHEEETMAEALAAGAAFVASEGRFDLARQIAETYILWLPALEGTKQYEQVVEYRNAALERLGISGDDEKEPTPNGDAPDPAPEPEPEVPPEAAVPPPAEDK